MASTNISQSGATSAIKVFANVTEESAEGNYRRVNISVVAYPQDNYGHIERDGSWSFYFEEEDVDTSGAAIITDAGMLLYEDTVDVYVEPGTTYANVNISFEATLRSPGAGNRTVSGAITLIKGLSLVANTAISSAKDIYFGDNCSITWTPASSSFTYKLKFSLGDYQYTTGILRPDNNTEPYTYTDLIIPETAAINIPDSEYGIVAVSLIQYSDYGATTTVGAASTKSFRITLKDNVVPKIDTYNATIDNSNNDVVDGWGIALVGYTKVNVTATASGVYGSTIKSFNISGDYKATVNGSTLDYVGKEIGRSGNRSFIIRCTDSRGRVSEQVVTDAISFLPYVSPKATKLVMKKEDYGDTSISNDRMVATATWSFDSVENKNSAIGKIYYKASTADDWTEHSGTLQSGVPFLMSDLKLSETISYNFKVVVTDALGSVSSREAFSSTTKVLMDYQAGGMGLGIGKICEIDNVANDTQSLEVSMDSYFFGEVFIKDKTQTLEDYIKSMTKYLVEHEDYGEEHPSEIDWSTPPQPGQIYYMKVSG